MTKAERISHSSTTRGKLMNQLNRPIAIGALVAGSLALCTATAVAQDQLADMTKDANQWVMTGRTYDLQRYSPLTQINLGSSGSRGMRSGQGYGSSSCRRWSSDQP